MPVSPPIIDVTPTQCDVCLLPKKVYKPVLRLTVLFGYPDSITPTLIPAPVNPWLSTPISTSASSNG